MERVVNIAKNHREAELWDIQQQTNMTPQERLEIAKELRRRAYGDDVKDVREATRENKCMIIFRHYPAKRRP
jgi:hypothetical protein